MGGVSDVKGEAAAFRDGADVENSGTEVAVNIDGATEREIIGDEGKA